MEAVSANIVVEGAPSDTNTKAYSGSQGLHRYEHRHHSSSFVLARQIVKRRRGRPRKDGGVCKQRLDKSWAPDETRVLIDQWRAQEVLYSQKHKQYHDKESRQEALRKIKTNLHQQGIDASEQQIFEKLISLRSYYCSQLSKIETARANGDSYYESNWKYFQELNFLSANVIPRKTEYISPFKDRDNEARPLSANHIGMSYLMGPPVAPHQEARASPRHHLYVPGPQSSLPLSVPVKQEVQHSADFLFATPSKPPPPYVPKQDLPTDRELGRATVQDLTRSPTYDEMFGELVAGMISEIPDCPIKDEVKINIQKLIVRRKHELMREKPLNRPHGMCHSATMNQAKEEDSSKTVLMGGALSQRSYSKPKLAQSKRGSPPMRSLAQYSPATYLPAGKMHSPTARYDDLQAVHRQNHYHMLSTGKPMEYVPIVVPLLD